MNYHLNQTPCQQGHLRVVHKKHTMHLIVRYYCILILSGVIRLINDMYHWQIVNYQSESIVYCFTGNVTIVQQDLLFSRHLWFPVQLLLNYQSKWRHVMAVADVWCIFLQYLLNCFCFCSKCIVHCLDVYYKRIYVTNNIRLGLQNKPNITGTMSICFKCGNIPSPIGYIYNIFDKTQNKYRKGTIIIKTMSKQRLKRHLLQQL